MTRVPIIRKIEMVNWNTTSTLLSFPPLKPVASFPLNISMGFTADKKNAGYEPANSPIPITDKIDIGISQPAFSIVNESCLPERLLKAGRARKNNTRAMSIAIAVTRTDSSRN